MVAAVLAVLIFWWQMGTRSRDRKLTAAEIAAILPTNIPILGPTAPPSPTPEPTATPTPVVAEELFLTHLVKSGETLLTIAGLYGSTVEEIQAANGLNDILIRIDDELIIPVVRNEDSNSASPISSEFTYVIKEGDTIVTIAVLFGSTVQDILDANQLVESDIIRPGDTLVVPLRDVPDDVLALDEAESTLPDAPIISSTADVVDATISH